MRERERESVCVCVLGKSRKSGKKNGKTACYFVVKFGHVCVCVCVCVKESRELGGNKENENRIEKQKKMMD